MAHRMGQPDRPGGRRHGGGAHGAPRSGGSSRSLVTWLVAFLGLSTLTILWSLTIPLASAPDEAHHIVKAAAVERGEWLGEHAPGKETALMTVVVPETFARTIGNFYCYRQRGSIPAGCAKKIVASPRLVAAATHVGRYPPLYYVLVGWPSRLSFAESTIRWMRVLSALLNSAILAFAFLLVRRFRMGAGVLAGLCCAITPVAVFMDSTIQPNGLEVSLAILLALAIIGLAQFVQRTVAGSGTAAVPPRLLVNTAGASAASLVLVRGLSPLWLACIAVLAIALIPWSEWRRWLALTGSRIWIAVILVCSGLSLSWIVGAQTLKIQPWVLNPYRHASDLRELQLVVNKSSWFVMQMLGAMTKEVQLPAGGYALGLSAIGLLVIAGFVRGTARERMALGVACAGTFLIPVVLAAPRIRVDGINWQGRYAMPLAVCIPLIAGLAAFGPSRRNAVETVRTRSRARRRTRERRTAALLITTSCALTGVAYWCLMRRYSVGTNGPHDLFLVTRPDWSPALPEPLLAAVVPLVLVGITVGALGLMAPSEPSVRRRDVARNRKASRARLAPADSAPQELVEPPPQR